MLYNLKGNYVIDFTTKHVSIYDRNGNATHNPIRFVGTPKSAAFRPSQGLIVIYDSLMSVWHDANRTKRRNFEEVEGWARSWFKSHHRRGDIDDGGRLVLALSDNTIVKVDIDATMDLQTWTTIGAPLRRD